MKKAISVLLTFTMMLIFCSCNSSKDTPIDQAKVNLYANQLIENDISTYIGYIKNDKDYSEADVVIIDNEKTYNADIARQFYKNYQAGKNAVLTVIFYETVKSSETFVVSRVIVDDTDTYYLRCQHDISTDNDKYAVTINSYISDIIFKEDNASNSIDIALYSNKNNIASLKLSNIIVNQLEKS